VERYTAIDSVELAFEIMGEGPSTVILLHGFAADHRRTWIRSGVAPALASAGFRCIMPDARGHGDSGAPRDPHSYGDELLVADVSSLIYELGLLSVDLIGYSMGAFTALRTAATQPRVRRLVAAGVGGNLESHGTHAGTDAIAAAMEAPRAEDIADTRARAYRQFADATGADLPALAALQRARSRARAIPFDVIHQPVLVIAGTDDSLAGSPAELAARMSNAISATVSGHHLNALFDPRFTELCAAFLFEDGILHLPGNAASQRSERVGE